MTHHLLVYDYDWWILGQKASTIQQYHPRLDILTLQQMLDLKRKKGIAFINGRYEMISTLGLGIAQSLLQANIRVDTSQIGSYNYLARNHSSYREWRDTIKPNHNFLYKVMKSIPQFAAINAKLTNETKKLLPDKKVQHIRPFVDTRRFQPTRKTADNELVIGWVGNERRKVKNYDSLYRAIVRAYKNKPKIKFEEATRASPVALQDMPNFYQKLDLLLITSANEGGPAPALEANASGVPVISTNVGFVKEIVNPRGKKLILNSDNPQHFIKKIDELATNEKRLAALKKEVRTHAVKYFAVEKTMEDWLASLFFI